MLCGKRWDARGGGLEWYSVGWAYDVVGAVNGFRCGVVWKCDLCRFIRVVGFLASRGLKDEICGIGLDFLVGFGWDVMFF